MLAHHVIIWTRLFVLLCTTSIPRSMYGKSCLGTVMGKTRTRVPLMTQSGHTINSTALHKTAPSALRKLYLTMLRGFKWCIEQIILITIIMTTIIIMTLRIIITKNILRTTIILLLAIIMTMALTTITKQNVTVPQKVRKPRSAPVIGKQEVKEPGFERN